MEQNLSELEQKWYDKGRKQGLSEGRRLEKEQTVLNALLINLKETPIGYLTGITSITELQYIIDKQQLKDYAKHNTTILSQSIEKISEEMDFPPLQVTRMLKELLIEQFEQLNQ